MENIKFICGGKTGDLLHNLFVIKLICEKFNKKGILYITNIEKYGGDKFNFDIHKTYYDLLPVITSQDYIDSLHILDDNEEIGEFINLNLWRQSKLFSKSNWIDLLLDNYKLDAPINEAWIKYKKITGLEDTILIHRSVHRHTPNFPWERIVNENKCTFITNNTTLQEYENFPFKNKVNLIACETFSDLVTFINSSKFFIGNMSTPLAISHCLGKPHLGELIYPDEIHYVGDEKYISNYFYIRSNGIKHIDGIEKFIRL